MRAAWNHAGNPPRTGAGVVLVASLLLGVGPPSIARADPSRAADPNVRPPSGQRAAIERVLDDYIRLYSAGTLDQWRNLFHPALSVAFPTEDGAIRVLNLDEFIARQKNYFATGRRIRERLENVRIDEGRGIARVAADFVFTDEDTERRGKLGLHLVQGSKAWKIAAIVFSYDDGG